MYTYIHIQPHKYSQKIFRNYIENNLAINNLIISQLLLITE